MGLSGELHGLIGFLIAVNLSGTISVMQVGTADSTGVEKKTFG